MQASGATVVTVRDERLPPGHSPGQQVNLLVVVTGPQCVSDPRDTGDRCRWTTHDVPHDLAGRWLRSTVGQQQGLQLSPDTGHVGGSLLDDLWRHVFVGQQEAIFPRAVVSWHHELTDQAALQDSRAPLLLVDVDGGPIVTSKHSAVQPAPQPPSGCRRILCVEKAGHMVRVTALRSRLRQTVIVLRRSHEAGQVADDSLVIAHGPKSAEAQECRLRLWSSWGGHGLLPGE